MIYTKNTQTNEIKTFEVDNYLQLSKNIRDQYIEATQEEIDAELLQEAKNTKLQKIEEIKQNSLYAPMSYNGRTFFTTEKANSNILGAILLDQTSYNWRDTSGNLVILNVADLKNLAALIAAQRGAVYNNEACKIIEVHNATTIEEVESITWQ